MKPNMMPLQLAQQSFLCAKEGEGVSPRTLTAYTAATDRFITYLHETGITDPATITPAIVRAYFAYLGKQGFSTHTVHDYARPVKTMLRFWFFDGIMSVNVMDRVKMPTTDKTVLPAFSAAEIKKILQACRSERDRAMCLFLLDTGLRCAELCALKVDDLDLTLGSVMVRHGKGDKPRVVYLGAKSKRALLKYLMTRSEIDTEDPLFPSLSQGGTTHLTTSGLFQTLQRIGDRAGVDDCHPHKFRRTCAIFSLRAGMDLFRLAQLLGHSDLTVLRQYLDFVQSDLADAHKRYGAVDKGLTMVTQ